MELPDANAEYVRLRSEQETFAAEKSRKKIGMKEKIVLPPLPKFQLPIKTSVDKVTEAAEQSDET